MIAVTTMLLLTLPPVMPDPPEPLGAPLMTTWRTRYVCDGREIDSEELDATRMKLVEVTVDGRRVRVAWFETKKDGVK